MAPGSATTCCHGPAAIGERVTLRCGVLVITLHDHARGHGFRTAGFDYLRIGLACAVFIYHAHWLSYGKASQDAMVLGPFGPVVIAVLPMFFGLSGYLVAGSLDRCKTVLSFLYLRAIRIYPALIADSLLCALIIGPIFTILPRGAYFSDPLFLNYFWNVLGHIQYDLPGVFLENPNGSKVNGQLWTVPFELECYVVIGALSLLGIVRFRYLLLLGTALAQIALSLRQVIVEQHPYPIFLGNELVLSFLWGICVYKFSDKIPFSRVLALVCAGLTVGILYGKLPSNFATLPLVYLTVFLGLQTPALFVSLKTGDYSYGIFLYGSPIQQALATFPNMREWYWSLAIAGPITIAFAVLSWHLLEKRALLLRRYVGVIDKMMAWSKISFGGKKRISPDYVGGA